MANRKIKRLVMLFIVNCSGKTWKEKLTSVHICAIGSGDESKDRKAEGALCYLEKEWILNDMV